MTKKLGWLLCLLPLPVHAIEGTVELGGMITRGNSTLNQLKAGLDLTHSAGDVSVELKAAGLRESGLNNTVTAERATVRTEVLNKEEWTQGQYLFVAPQWRYNRFSYVVRATELFAGTGWQWGSAPVPVAPGAPAVSPPPDTLAWKLRFELGPGYRYSQLSTAEDWWEPVFLLRSQGDGPLGRTLRIEGDMALEIGERVSEWLGRVAIRQQVTERVALKLTWSQVYTVPVAQDKRATDTSVALSLAYSF